MSDMVEPAQDARQPEQNPVGAPTIEDLTTVDFEEPITGTQCIDCFELYMEFGKAAAAAAVAGDEAARRVFTCLTNVSTLHLKVDDKANPYGPLFQLTDGGRSAAPEDFRELVEVLAAVAPQVKNPGLRARIADIAWLSCQFARKSVPLFALKVSPLSAGVCSRPAA
jgi:hypothetical protein